MHHLLSQQLLDSFEPDIGVDPWWAVWHCRMGIDRDSLSDITIYDNDMRRALDDVLKVHSGREADFIFSGWGGSVPEPYRAVIEKRTMDHDRYQAELAKDPAVRKLMARVEEFVREQVYTEAYAAGFEDAKEQFSPDVP